MSKTIQLISTTDNQRLNVILSGSTLSIDGKRYALTDHDLTRLLMFCEDNAERINQRVYTGCQDYTGKEFNHIEKVER